MGPQHETIEMGEESERSEPHEGLTLLADKDKRFKYGRSSLGSSLGNCLHCTIEHMCSGVVLTICVVFILVIAVLVLAERDPNSLQHEHPRVCGLEPDPIMKLKEKATGE